jgi:hypothetical protein
MKPRVEQLGDDIFWSIFDPEEKKMITWQGYSDNFWWKNVSKTDQFRINGKYKLDPDINEVTIVE